MPTSIYLAGKIRQVSDRGRSYREHVKQRYPQFSYLDPCRRNFNGDLDYSPTLSNEARAIVQADLLDIATCDILLADCRSGPSFGTAAEIFAAKQLNKTVIVIITPDWFNDPSYCTGLK